MKAGGVKHWPHGGTSLCMYGKSDLGHDGTIHIAAPRGTMATTRTYRREAELLYWFLLDHLPGVTFQELGLLLNDKTLREKPPEYHDESVEWHPPTVPVNELLNDIMGENE